MYNLMDVYLVKLYLMEQFFNTKIYGITIERCKAMGIAWNEASFSNISINCPLEFRNTDISYSSFGSLKLHNTNITNCKAKEVDFTECDLSDSDFKESDFYRSIFYKTNLSGASFVGAKNYAIDPLINKVTKAEFSLPEVLGLLDYLEIKIIL